MRIAMVSTTAVRVPPTGYGGTERIIHYLVEGLVRAGHAVTLFATGDSETAGELRALYPEAVWPIDSLAEIDHATWSLAQIDASRFDVVHLHFAPAIAVARFVDVPVVYTIHHPREEALTRFYRRFPQVHYVAISERQRALETPLPRTRVIHHGLDPADYPFVPVAGDHVAFIGRFAPVKGPHHAIDAAHAAGVPIRLAGAPHVGEGESYHAREMEPRLALPDVTWVGEVGGTAKAEHLGRARATLFPIAWEEPFGLVMVESMLCGTPVIAFPGGAAAEVIDEGTTGFIVRDVTEMTAAIARAGALDRARCRAQAIERFPVDRMVRQYLEVYGAAAVGRPIAPARRTLRAPSPRVVGPLGTAIAERQ
jgi:glycosyltransferase involved in cell wall biosynthesis